MYIYTYLGYLIFVLLHNCFYIIATEPLCRLGLYSGTSISLKVIIIYQKIFDVFVREKVIAAPGAMRIRLGAKPLYKPRTFHSLRYENNSRSFRCMVSRLLFGVAGF